MTKFIRVLFANFELANLSINFCHHRLWGRSHPSPHLYGSANHTPEPWSTFVLRIYYAG